MNILITSVSKKVSLVKAFKQALANEKMAGNVIGIDVNCYSAAFHFCDKKEICPRLDDPDFTNFLKIICTKHNIKLIIPTRDADALFFSKNKTEFEDELNLKIMVSDFESVEICNDKYKFYEFLSQNNLPTIKSWKIINSEIEFPCVIKDNEGAAAKNFYIINSKEELIKKYNLIKKPIIQEYIQGTEYTVDYFADFDANPVIAVPRIRLLVEAGESKVGITKKDDLIIKKTEELGKKLKLKGHNIVQFFKLEDGSIKFIEVNPRYGGASNLCFASGAHTPTLLLRLINNRYLGNTYFKENYVMLRYSEDVFIENDKIDNI